MRSTTRRVVVTGLGSILPHGHNPEQVFQRLLRGESAVRLIKRFDTSGSPCKIGATVENFRSDDFVSDRAARRLLRLMDPVHQWALCASQQAMVDAGFGLESPRHPGPSPERFGVYIGTGLSGREILQRMAAEAFGKFRTQEWESVRYEDLVRRISEVMSSEVNPMYFLQQCPSIAAACIAMCYKARGPNLTAVSLCAASAQAIGEAAWIIARGDADVMLAGGTDSMLNPVDLPAFCALNAVTGRSEEVEGASKPFDIRRDGCVVGEGAVMLLLECRESALTRGARIYAEIAGYGTSDDAYKISAPPENGDGALLAMRQALYQADLQPSEVQHINAHGTSTPLNDKIETLAIKRLLGQHAYNVPIVSTKSMTGHLIAAAGGLEALIAIKCLEHRRIPPTINLQKQDPQCDLDYVPDGSRIIQDLNVVMSNSFAIGGVNASLVFTRDGDR